MTISLSSYHTHLTPSSTPTEKLTTRSSNADAPTPYTPPSSDTSTLVFAKPHEELQPFSSFLTYLTTQELQPPSIINNPHRQEEEQQKEEVRYAQTQNDNLRHEYAALFAHVPRTIPWARLALARDPDAVNLWIGNARSVTALHKDNYENVYVQVAGRKHFVLLPPVCQPCVAERGLRPAHYRRRRRRASSGDGGGGGGLELVLDEGGEEEQEEVPFAVWDPDRPAENATRYSALVQPMRVTLNPGDMLYLPCMWWVGVAS